MEHLLLRPSKLEHLDGYLVVLEGLLLVDRWRMAFDLLGLHCEGRTSCEKPHPFPATELFSEVIE